MPWLRGALSCIPVLGPAADALDSAAHGDRVGAAVELCSLALDVCSTMSHFNSAFVIWKAAGPTRLLLQQAVVRGAGSKVYGLAAARRLVAGAAKVVKTALKQKVAKRAKRVAIKVGLAAAIALAQEGTARLGLRQKRHPQSLGQGTLHFPSAVTGERLEGQAQIFEARSSREAQLHAVLSREVYLPSDQRRGVAAFFDTQSSESGPDGMLPGRRCWYAYVGGNDYRGFWYSPGNLHLVLAERGTAVADTEDLVRDACLALGSGLAALSSRAQASIESLKLQLECHDSARVTVTGHSLGGAVAVFLAATAGGSRAGGQAQLVDAVHAFNAGGLPDITRSLSLALSKAEVHVHRIQGDLVSVGFLPFFQKCYCRRPELGSIDPHSMMHFQPSWHLENPQNNPSLLLLRPRSLPSSESQSNLETEDGII